MAAVRKWSLCKTQIRYGRLSLPCELFCDTSPAFGMALVHALPYLITRGAMVKCL